MKIAIAGFGAEGKSNYAYYAAQGGHQITIVDERDVVSDLPSNVPLILGEGAFTKLQDFDLVVRTAGLNPNKIKTNGKIWSATNEFFAKCPAQIIGVTGTKGKGTTASLITEILRAGGKTVHLVGNIGIPSLDELSKITPTDLVVYELSSFQLWDLEKSPHVAVILYMEPDHLDVHKDMDEYVRAKANIRLHQTLEDICFYHPSNLYTQQIVEMRGDYSTDDFKHRDWRWRAFRYGVNEIRDPSVAISYVEQGLFCIKRSDSEKISTIPTSVLKIPGTYNQQNACAAIDATLVYGVSDDAISQGLSAFHGLPHRLQLIREVNSIKYYDDSYATVPGSAAAVMQSFKEPKVMILGGSSKGAAFEELARAASTSQVRAVIAIGAEAGKIEQAMRDRNVVVFNVGSQISMKEIVALATVQAQPGDLVLLSPGCASFGMFKNYSDRGDQFDAAVKEL
jgi:UDP-N-acetylmuramoylalanine--D-glutamate ligase